MGRCPEITWKGRSSTITLDLIAKVPILNADVGLLGKVRDSADVPPAPMLFPTLKSPTQFFDLVLRTPRQMRPVRSSGITLLHLHLALS